MSTRRLPSGVAPSVRSRSLAFIGPALLTLAAPAAMAQAEPFITPVIKTDSTVLDVVPAMLGGGGVTDLVVSMGGLHLALMPGVGDGSFGSGQVVMATQDSVTFAAADFDGDGHDDVAALQYDPAAVHVLLGQPGPALALASSVTLPAKAAWPRTTDADHDGDIDLVLSSYDLEALIVLENVGDGSFLVHATLPHGLSSTDMDLGDLDADGAPDVVLAISDGAAVAVLAGDGAGGFGAPAVQALAPEGLIHLRTGDFDGNGMPDLVRWKYDSLVVHFGLPGGFGTAFPIAEDDANPLAVADLDEDGRDDLVCGTSALTVRLSQGDGAWSPGAEYGGPAYPDSVVVGDVVVDGDLDVLTAGNATYGTISILAGRGDGQLGPLHASATFLGMSFDVLAGDLDEDGRADLLSFGGPDFSSLVLLPGIGSGFFGAPTLVPTQPSPRRAALADFDADGHLDVLVGHDDRGTLHLGTGAPGFGPPTDVWVTTDGDYQRPAVADVDSDGRMDAVIANDTQRLVLLGQGDGTFHALPKHVGAKPPGELALVDLDADGNPDIVVTARDSFSGGLSVLLGWGGGRFGPAVNEQLGLATYRLDVADIDLDGDLDVATGGGQASFISSLNLHRNDGRGELATSFFVNTGLGADRDLALGDFDRDGWPDLATAGWSSFSDLEAPGLVQVWSGLASGAAQKIQDAWVRSAPRSIVAADLDGDGATDLATSDGPTVLINRLGPWHAVGNALAGALGPPKLVGEGPFTPGSSLSLTLSDAAPVAAAFLVAGLGAGYLPFKAGVLVPVPEVVLGPVWTSPDGGCVFGPIGPVGLPAGATWFAQSWIVDDAAPAGFAASNGLSAISQ